MRIRSIDRIVRANMFRTGCLVACIAWICSSPAAAATRKGLVLAFDAARNAGGHFDPKATVWSDLSGRHSRGRLRNYDKPTWVGSGKPGDPYCLRLNGRGNYVEVPNPAGFDAGSGFTIEALARVRQNSLVREEMAPFLACGGMGSVGDFNLQVRSGGRQNILYVNTQMLGRAGRILNGGPKVAVPDNTFAHFVYTYDPKGAVRSKWFVNGKLADSDNGLYELAKNSSPFWIGSHQAGKKHRLDADIAIIRLYSRALTVKEIGENHREAVARAPSAGTVVKVVARIPKSSGLTAAQARVIVTGYDFNLCDPYPGRGKFGWPGNIQRLANGDLMMVHSWGYWHSSFAQPRLIKENTAKRWRASGWPLDFPAPTGGRCMFTRSSDNGRTWSKPKTLYDHYLDDGAYGLIRCKDGTLLCFAGVQASWYGFTKAPTQFKKDINGLNTSQYVVRSTDGGKTWSEPIWLESPGKFYQRCHAQPLLLPSGSILWATYCADGPETKDRPLFGAIHRSDDCGRTWRLVSTLRRKGKPVDEPAIALLKDGRLILVTRPDSALFYSSDEGKTWTESGRIVSGGTFKAPWMCVLSDGTIVCVATWRNLRVFLSKDAGKTWTHPIPLDTSCYGYPGGFLMEDESILISYVDRGAAPARIYVIRFKVNASRDGIDILPIGSPPLKR